MNLPARVEARLFSQAIALLEKNFHYIKLDIYLKYFYYIIYLEIIYYI